MLEVCRITNKTEVVLGETNAFSYAYDVMGRLTQVYTNGALCSSYGYDAHGNRMSFTSSTEVVTNMVYDDHDRLLEYGDTAYTYNLAGDLVAVTNQQSAIENRQFSYDSFGNLLSVDLNGTNITYTVDPLNRRIGKNVNDAPVQKFIYQNQINPVAELDGSNNVVSVFVYGNKGNVPAYMVKDGATYRIISDHLGSVRLVVNADTGEVAQRMDYDEFGNVLFDSNPGFQPFGFQGGLYDRDTGLVRFGARDYDPKIGRWLTKDALGFAAGINFYVFCANDPINRIDSTGYLTLSEANQHWREGGGTPLVVDIGTLDLSNVTQLPLSGQVSFAGKNFSSVNDALVYGTATFQSGPDNTVTGGFDYYNFDLKPWSTKTFIRNVETIAGRIYAGPGMPYRIEFIGTAKLEGGK